MIVADPDMADGERAKVLDFGIAKLVVEGGGTGLTQTGMSMGTPRYMAPEQSRNARDVTDKSDIYALGLMLFEMLSGEQPFPKISSDTELIWAHMNQGMPPLGSRCPEASPELRALVDRMLSRQPTARPSAADVSVALRKMNGSASSTAIPMLAGASGDANAPVLGSAPPPSPTAMMLPPPAEPPSPNTGRLVVLGAGGALLIGAVGLFVVVRALLHPPPPPLPTTVHWHIVSQPAGAEVVDEGGQVLGKTPLDRTEKLGKDSPTLTLRLAGFAEYRVTASRAHDVDSQIELTALPPPPPTPPDDEQPPPKKGKGKGKGKDKSKPSGGKQKKKGARGK